MGFLNSYNPMVLSVLVNTLTYVYDQSKVSCIDMMVTYPTYTAPYLGLLLCKILDTPCKDSKCIQDWQHVILVFKGMFKPDLAIISVFLGETFTHFVQSPILDTLWTLAGCIQDIDPEYACKRWLCFTIILGYTFNRAKVFPY